MHSIVGEMQDLINKPIEFRYDNEISIAFILDKSKYGNFKFEFMVNGIPVE